ncbi:hypothetical protein [Lentzea cavernae]|uniref:SLATT domain-containing protein n=1 Tax=Lentzea cavernae TaxID=2020703 RepID=A0ABQ3M3V1_9PSEU|nr:hypothetical protein [Lentzea cavernae]GHH32503.1 hypothetical protein GCM10017774_13510 [Lentzea cavernae]
MNGRTLFGPLSDLARRAAVAMGMTVTLLLPPEQRSRYQEEFRAEFEDLGTTAAVVHAAGLLTASWSLRTALRTPGRQQWLIPFAAVAAVLAIGFTGISIAAREAQPGDVLWGLTRVLYRDYAFSVEAAAIIHTDLESARLALREGKVDEARTKLGTASGALPGVSPDAGKEQLATLHQELTKQMDTSAPTERP